MAVAKSGFRSRLRSLHLSVLPHRLTFFEQGPEPFSGIFELEQLIEIDILGAFEGIVEGHPGSVEDDPLEQLQHGAAFITDALDQRIYGFLQSRARHHAIDQSHLQRHLSVDWLARQQELHGAARPDDARIDHGPERWENAQLDFRLAELRFFRSN